MSWLFSESGREFLQKEYVEKGRSTRTIAMEQNTYPNKVIRALKLHGMPVRGRSEARKVGLAQGHIEPPMLGKTHPQQVRDKIANSLHQTKAGPKEHGEAQAGHPGPGSGDGTTPGGGAEPTV